MKKTENKKETQNKLPMTFGVANVREFSNGSVGFTLIINGIIKLYGCTVVEGNFGDFISFASYKGSDGKYYNHFYIPLDQQEQSDIIKLVEEKL